jgi:hypothetical protein
VRERDGELYGKADGVRGVAPGPSALLTALGMHGLDSLIGAGGRLAPPIPPLHRMHRFTAERDGRRWAAAGVVMVARGSAIVLAIEPSTAVHAVVIHFPCPGALRSMPPPAARRPCRPCRPSPSPSPSEVGVSGCETRCLDVVMCCASEDLDDTRCGCGREKDVK